MRTGSANDKRAFEWQPSRYDLVCFHIILGVSMLAIYAEDQNRMAITSDTDPDLIHRSPRRPQRALFFGERPHFPFSLLIPFQSSSIPTLDSTHISDTSSWIRLIRHVHVIMF